MEKILQIIKVISVIILLIVCIIAGQTDTITLLSWTLLVFSLIGTNLSLIYRSLVKQKIVIRRRNMKDLVLIKDKAKILAYFVIAIDIVLLLALLNLYLGLYTYILGLSNF